MKFDVNLFKAHLRAGSAFNIFSPSTPPVGDASVPVIPAETVVDAKKPAAASSWDVLRPHRVAKGLEPEPQKASEEDDIVAAPAEVTLEASKQPSIVKTLKPKTSWFKDGLSGFIFGGKSASLAKTLATYLVAPLYYASFPLLQLSNLMLEKFRDLVQKRKNLALKVFLFVLLTPINIVGNLFFSCVRLLRGALRLTLALPAEGLNFLRALVLTLRGVKESVMHNQSLPPQTGFYLMGFFDLQDDVKIAPIMKKENIFYVGLTILTLGILPSLAAIDAHKKKASQDKADKKAAQDEADKKKVTPGNAQQQPDDILSSQPAMLYQPDADMTRAVLPVLTTSKDDAQRFDAAAKQQKSA